MRPVPDIAAKSIPNLAPMVDVIMVLLVFFLLGATLDLAQQGVLQTELDPRSGPGPGSAITINPRVVIALRPAEGDGGVQVSLVGEPLGVNAFGTLFSALDQRREAGADIENPIVIAAEPSVRWRSVVQAMDAADQAGFGNVQFAVSLQPETP